MPKGSKMQIEEHEELEPDIIGEVEPLEEDLELSNIEEPEQITEPEGPNYEDEARLQGWRPKEEFKGNPDQWRDAETFVKRGKEIVSVVRRELDTAREEFNQTLQQRDEQHRESLRRVAQVNKKALENQRLSLLGQIEKEKKEAVKFGDVEAYDNAIEREEEILRTPIVEEYEQDTQYSQQPQAPQAPPEINDWVAQNNWAASDPVLKAMVLEEHNKLLQVSPYMPLAENLEQVKEAVMERFPEKFGRSRKAAPKPSFSAVEGTQRNAAPRSSAVKGWDQIPQSDRAQANDFIKDGIFKSKEEYATAYWSDDNA